MKHFSTGRVPNSDSFWYIGRARLKSKHRTLLLLFDFFKTGTAGGWAAASSLSVLLLAAWMLLALCLLIWPPSACPMGNSIPQMEHWWFFGFGGDWGNSNKFPADPTSFGFLWLARWPPNAWNEEKFLLHVLHENKRPAREGGSSWSSSPLPTLYSSIKHLAMSNSPSSLPLFIAIELIASGLDCVMRVQETRSVYTAEEVRVVFVWIFDGWNESKRLDQSVLYIMAGPRR